MRETDEKSSVGVTAKVEDNGHVAVGAVCPALLLWMFDDGILLCGGLYPL